ncbi:MAG: restriction endonuclease subunit S [Actinomyces sp.]|nr:restriction endonuclease subunit S [Actinomyces sp.]
MSRLAELIEELCPDGVEYRALGDVGVFVRGGGLQKADFVEAGMPCVHYGQIHTRFGISTTMAVSSVSEAQFARLKHADYGDLLIATTSEDDEAVGKATAWLGEGEVAISGDMFYYRHNLEPKYVSYFFASSSFQEQKRPYLTGAKVRRIADKGLSRIQIPVPPLEVQREIVRILDQFTTLEARRTQYEHYRNDLLSYESLATHGRMEWCALGDLGTFVRGGGLQKADFVEQGKPCIHYGQIHTIFGVSTDSVVSSVSEEQFLRLKHASLGDLLIATTSEDDEAVAKATAWLGDEPVAISGDMFLFRHSLDPRYVSHFFASQHFQEQKRPFLTGAKVRRISEKGLKRILIPVPSREEQRRIADLLDRFDSLVNDISSGLPAEIEARRTQYEYYRDRLLSFPEKPAD